jgi:GTP-binding protein LepA
LGCKLEEIYARENWFRCRKYLGCCYRKNSLQKEMLMSYFDLDSHYNPFRGIEVIFRVINGEIKKAKRLSYGYW